VDRSDREYDEFVRSRTPALLRLAYLLTGDQHLAEDLVQTALARTHQAWSRLRAVGNAEAYARRTMYHLQVSWWRRPKVPESRLAEVPERVDPADPSDRVALRPRCRSPGSWCTESQPMAGWSPWGRAAPIPESVGPSNGFWTRRPISS
jgi:DNA-directed RNA polymerase specialized sigma24 family protein